MRELFVSPSCAPDRRFRLDDLSLRIRRCKGLPAGRPLPYLLQFRAGNSCRASYWSLVSTDEIYLPRFGLSASSSLPVLSWLPLSWFGVTLVFLLDSIFVGTDRCAPFLRGWKRTGSLCVRPVLFAFEPHRSYLVSTGIVYREHFRQGLFFPQLIRSVVALRSLLR